MDGNQLSNHYSQNNSVYRRLRRAAVIAWIVTTIAIAIVVTVGKPGKLYSTFAAAGDHFRTGEQLYPETIPDNQVRYRYSPLVAATFAPMALLATPAGAVLWRCLQAIALFFAIRAWSRIAVPNVSWPLVALVALPLSIGNLHNGQLNPLVTALMLAAVVAFADDRYWLAALAIAGAALFKIYPLSLGLLLCIVEPRRFTPRLIVVVAAATIIPFLVQSPNYVLGQFEEWFQLLNNDDRTNQSWHQGYHDFQKLLLRYGIPISLTAYRGIEVAAGGIAALVILCGRYRGWDRNMLIQACTWLGFLWCTLFGPATESATYMIIAPIIAHAVVAVMNQTLWERIWIRGTYAIFLSANCIHWFPYSVSHAFRGTLIPQAHAALLLLAWVVWMFVRFDSESAQQRSSL